MCVVTAVVAAVAAAATMLAAAVAIGVASALWEARTFCSRTGVFQLRYIGRFDFLCEPSVIFAGLVLVFVEHSYGGFNSGVNEGRRSSGWACAAKHVCTVLLARAVHLCDELRYGEDAEVDVYCKGFMYKYAWACGSIGIEP